MSVDRMRELKKEAERICADMVSALYGFRVRSTESETMLVLKTSEYQQLLIENYKEQIRILEAREL